MRTEVTRSRMLLAAPARADVSPVRLLPVTLLPPVAEPPLPEPLVPAAPYALRSLAERVPPAAAIIVPVICT